MVKTLYNDVTSISRDLRVEPQHGKSPVYQATSISRDLRVEPQLVARLEFTTDKYIKGFES